MDADLQLRAIRTPTRVEFHLPHLPMYRFNGQCDSTIVWDFPTAVEEVGGAEEVRVYPNPADQVAYINLPADHTYAQGYVLNTMGQPVRSILLTPGQTNVRIATGDLPSGMYYVQFDRQKDGILKLVITH